MTIPLVYEISATGEDRLRRVLRGVESEVKASASRVDRVGRSGGRARPDQATKETARGFDQIGRAARAADTQLYRQRISHERAVARERERLDRRAQMLRERDIAKAARAETMAARRAAQAKIRSREAMGRGVATTVTGSIGTALGTAARGGAVAAGILGGVGSANALDEEIRVRARASALANQAGDPRLKGVLAKESSGIKGVGRMEALEGLGAFTDLTGDLKTAREIQQFVGKLHHATGADLQELMATAGNAWIPINDGAGTYTEKLERLKEVVSALAGQGSVGAVEIKDLAKEFATLAATSNKFEGDRPTLMKKMGVIAQAARQRGGADSAAEAVTAAARFSTDVTTKSKDLKALGVDVFDKTGTQLKDPEELIVEILKKTKGKLAPNTELFGERGIRAMQGFSPLFNAAERNKAGSGEAAVRKEFARLMQAELSVIDAEMRARSRLSDEDIKAKEAMKRFNEAVGTRLIPLITELVPKFEQLIPKAADLAQAFVNGATFLIENPWKGLGALVAATVVKDLVAAGIGSVVGGVLARLVAGAGTVLFGTGAVGAAGAAGATGAGAAGTAAGLAGAAGVAGKVGLIGKAGAAVTAAGGAATAGLAAATAGAVGLAGYQGYKLYEETKNDDLFDLLFKGPARPASGAEYDRYVGYGAKEEPGTKQLEAPDAAVMKTEEAARQQQEAAKATERAAGTLHRAAMALNTGTQDTRRNQPLLAR